MSCRVTPVNYADTATVTVGTAEAAGYPVTNLQSNLRDRVWRTVGTASHVVTVTFPAARTISFWGLWPGADMIGSQVAVVAKLAAATVYTSGTLDFLDFAAAGWSTPAWGTIPWTVEPALSIARRAPLQRHITPVSADTLTFTFTDVTLAPAFFEVRRLWVGEYIDAPNVNARVGAASGWESNSNQMRTLGGSLIRRVGSPHRKMRFEVFLATEADRLIWNNIMYACDLGREVVFSLFQDAGKKGDDFTVMGSLRVLNPMVFGEADMHTLEIEIVES